MDHTYEVDNIVQATRTASVTLVGYIATKFPMSGGNCFSVIVDNKEYKVVNFSYENLRELQKRGVIEWPLDVIPIGDHHCVVADHRIPNEWYSNRFCETCTPRNLLPPQQKLQRVLNLKSGIREEKTVTIDGVEQVIVKMNFNAPAGMITVPYTMAHTVPASIDGVIDDKLKSKYEGREIDNRFYGRVYIDDSKKSDEQS